MARLDYSGIQQDEQKQEIGNLPGQTGGAVSGAAGGFSRPSTNQPGTGGAVSGGGSVSAPQGSKFTNIQQYLQANQGAGQAMAGQVGQTVDKSITRTGGNINKAKEELAKLNQAEQERLSGAERAGQIIQEDPTQIGGVTPAPSQEPEQVQSQQPIIPDDQTPSDDRAVPLPQVTPVEPKRGEPEFTIEDIGRFRAGLEGSDYDLINERLLEQVTGLNPEMTRSINLAGDTATEQGRYNLLRESLGRPGYTSGEQRLDQLIVQSEGQGVLRELQKRAAERASGLASQYDQYRDEAMTNQEALREAVMAAQGTINRAIGNWSAEDQEGALGRLYNDLWQRAQNLPAELEGAYNSAIQKLITDPSTLTQEEHDLLGVVAPGTVFPGGPPEGTLYSDINMYGYDFDEDSDSLLPKYDLSGFTTEALMGNVATEQDRARLSALRQIADLTDTEAYLGEGVELPGTTLSAEDFHTVAKRERGRLISEGKRLSTSGAWHDPKISKSIQETAKHFKTPTDQLDYMNKVFGSSDFVVNNGELMFKDPYFGPISITEAIKYRGHPSKQGGYGAPPQLENYMRAFLPNEWDRYVREIYS